MNFFLTAGFFVDAIQKGIIGLLLAIDGIVYWVISILFELYEELATFEFLTTESYELITNRIFVVIGVVMLFYLAYALLKALVNPDELNKITSKIVSNIVISLVLINVVPYIFSYAYEIQNIVLGKDNIVGKLILGNANSNLAKTGKATAMTFLEAFLRPDENIEIKNNSESGKVVYKNWDDLKICIIDNETTGCVGNESFRHVALLSDSVVSGDTDYIFLISTACGIFLIYIIASFCIDLGIRVVKLAFYQIIAPIPIIMRIIPEKKSVFDNWVKATFATYLEVFIRLAIMYIIVFFAALIPDLIGDVFEGELGLIGVVVVLMGIFAFAKQAPKLIGDVIGVDGGSIKLGIRDKLANGGAFMAGAAIGGGVTALTRNAVHGFKNFKDSKGQSNLKRAGAFAGMITGTVAGGLSGFGRGAKSGWGAKNSKDMRTAAGTAASEVTTKRDKKEAYRANHGGRIGAMKGHFNEKKESLITWAGIATPLEQLQIEQKNVQAVANARKAVNDKLNKLVEIQQNERNSTVEQVVNGVGSFKNLTTLQNELALMKSTGKTRAGRIVNANQIREMQIAEEKLKAQLKKDILNGYSKNGYTKDIDGLDGNLKELLVAYRTEVEKNYNSIDKNADKSKYASSLSSLETALINKNKTINEFIEDGHAQSIFDGGNKAINDANSRLGQEITTNIQNQRKNSSDS